MDLNTYFTANDGKVHRDGAKLTAVAERCDITPYYLYMVVKGHKQVSPELATKIQSATQGVCTRRETCPDFPWDEPGREAA